MGSRITEEEKRKIFELYNSGSTIKEIAELTEKKYDTIWHLIRRTTQPKEPIRKKPQKEENVPFDARRSSAFPTEATPRVIKNMPSEGIRRGQIYYITKEPVCGAEIEAGRPGIVVSNDRINFGGFVEIVFLTTKEKKEMPTHVTIHSSGTIATALCEQVQTISRLRVREYCGKCTDTEMAMIDTAIAISLGLDFEATPVQAETKPEPQVEFKDDNADYKVAMAERDIYKALYNELVEKLLRR